MTTLHFSACATVNCTIITINEDLKDESVENFTVVLLNPSDPRIDLNPDTVEISIEDNDGRFS